MVIPELYAYLYNNYFLERNNCVYTDLSGLGALLGDGLLGYLRLLEVEGQVSSDGQMSWRLTSCGVVEAETKGYCSPEQALVNKSTRLKILTLLQSNVERGRIETRVDELCSVISESNVSITANIGVLCHLEYVRWSPDGFCRLQASGLEFMKCACRSDDLKQRYDQIRVMKPQDRGIAFQGLIADVFLLQGWEARHGIRLRGEDADVFVSKDSHHYLIECKWCDDRIGTSVVREFATKLTHRPRVTGVIMSMSGFTGPAVEAAREVFLAGPMLLFGGLDIERLITGAVSATDLIQRKELANASERRVEYA